MTTAHAPAPGQSPALIRYACRALDYAAYIHRPALWPAISRNIAHKLSGKIPDRAKCNADRAEASQWCAQHCIPHEDLLHALFPGERTCEDPQAAFPDVYKDAQARVDAIPCKMGGAADCSLLYTLCRKLGAQTVIETGVACGWSSLAVLLSMKDKKDARLYSVDLPYFERHNDKWVGTAVPEDTSLRKNWTLFRMADREALPKIFAKVKHADLIHYDSDKSAEGRLWAYPQLWDRLRPGGILISDDIQDNLGFAQFCNDRGLTPLIVSKDATNYVGILKKS